MTIYGFSGPIKETSGGGFGEPLVEDDEIEVIFPEKNFVTEITIPDQDWTTRSP
jgi:hypothetical protein